jgi:antitoxin FitA
MAISKIVIHYLEPDLSQLLEQRAAQNGHTIEAEIKAILQSVLAPPFATKPNLTTAIEQRFAPLGNFEFPEITREPIRTSPNFETPEG